MIARFTSVVKPSRGNEAVEMLQDFWKRIDLPFTHRIYEPITGSFQEVFQEIEFEDFEQYEKFWADVGSNPEWPQWQEKWHTIEVSTSVQLLTLVE